MIYEVPFSKPMSISAHEQLQSGSNSRTPKISLVFFTVALVVIALAPAASAASTVTDANWTPLGSGLNNAVYALAGSSTNLYVGGKFTAAGGVTANRVAKWDGRAW